MVGGIEKDLDICVNAGGGRFTCFFKKIFFFFTKKRKKKKKKNLPLNWASQGIRTEKENRQSAYLTSKKQVRNTHTHTDRERERKKTRTKSATTSSH